MMGVGVSGVTRQCGVVSDGHGAEGDKWKIEGFVRSGSPGHGPALDLGWRGGGKRGI